MARPILLLEINEVPWRLIDHFIDDPRFANIKAFFNRSATFTTIAQDTGELSPWVTWPTFHRGISNQEHKIFHLGQDPASYKGVPIWDEYLNRGYSVGVCGSLQSWPPKDPGKNGFYIPDTFAHDSSCSPSWVEPFQRYNLKQVSKNGRVVNSGFMNAELLSLIAALPKLGISVKTLAKTGMQLVSERFNKNLLSRRPIFQTILMWDIFKKLYNAENPPEFSTFFTNHVAGVMHRYWNDVFPEDFDESRRRGDRPYLDTMIFALEFLDRILSDAMSFQKKNPELILVFASSMGQAAVIREGHCGMELAVGDIPKLIGTLGFERSSYEPLLAMVPQVAIEVKDVAAQDKIINDLHSCKTASGKQLFKVNRVSVTLSITIITPLKEDITSGFFYFNDRKISWIDAGIDIVDSEAGTGYHIPQGSMAILGSGIAPASTRDTISATAVKTRLMQISGIA